MFCTFLYWYALQFSLNKNVTWISLGFKTVHVFCKFSTMVFKFQNIYAHGNTHLIVNGTLKLKTNVEMWFYPI